MPSPEPGEVSDSCREVSLSLSISLLGIREVINLIARAVSLRLVVARIYLDMLICFTRPDMETQRVVLRVVAL